MAACAKCGGSVAAGEAFCGACGATVEGAVPALPAKVRLGDKYARQVHGGNVKSGRGAILAVAILQAIGGILIYVVLKNQGADDSAALLVSVINFVLSGIFFGLWIWAKSSPLAASVTALVIFLTVHLANAVMDPKTLIQGIIVKVIVIVCLVKGIQSAAAYKRMQERV